MVSDFGSEFPFGFLRSDPKRAVRISRFPAFLQALWAVLATFWVCLRSSSHSGVWWGKKRFEGMFVSAVDFIREIKWESVLSIRWGLEE